MEYYVIFVLVFHPIFCIDVVGVAGADGIVVFDSVW